MKVQELSASQLLVLAREAVLSIDISGSHFSTTFKKTTSEDIAKTISLLRALEGKIKQVKVTK